ncbi:hypothetical protein CBL_10470 [Carabus blaptoides fortunei]
MTNSADNIQGRLESLEGIVEGMKVMIFQSKLCCILAVSEATFMAGRGMAFRRTDINKCTLLWGPSPGFAHMHRVHLMALSSPTNIAMAKRVAKERGVMTKDEVALSLHCGRLWRSGIMPASCNYPCEKMELRCLTGR